MPLFHRNHDDPGAEGSSPSSRLSEASDWRAYGPVAGDYERLFGQRFGEVASDLVGLTGIPSGTRILDVGTGTGILARAAAAAGGPGVVVVGVDASPGMLGVAGLQDGGPRYAAAEAIDLPFRDGTFDAVVSQFVIHHFTKYQTALFDMLRVLRPRGRMGTAVWGKNDDAFSLAWQEVMEEFAEREILQDARDRAAPWRALFADPSNLHEALHDAGLREIRIDQREYRFVYSPEQYVASQEITPVGRFLRQMLGDEFWGRFQARAREVFAERFPPEFNDFRDVTFAVGTKP